MARRFPHPKSRTSSTRGLKLAALQLIALGAFLVVWPYVLPKMIWSEMAKGFLPVGGIAIVSGIVLWMLASARMRGEAASDSHDVDDARTKRSRKLRSPSAREPHTFERTANVIVATAGNADAHQAPPVRPQAWACEVFEQIEWRRFEAVVEALFAQAGFATKSQSHGADGGVDVWLYAKGKPDTPVSIVQCKHWSGKAVGVDKIRELRGVMA